MRSMLLNICLYHYLTGFDASALATSLVELTKTIRETKITINTPSTTSPSPPLTTPTSAYGVISARSASPVHLLPMNAVGQAFYLGGEPTSYCPLIKQTDCPAGNVTSFKGFGSLVRRAFDLDLLSNWLIRGSRIQKYQEVNLCSSRPMVTLALLRLTPPTILLAPYWTLLPTLRKLMQLLDSWPLRYLGHQALWRALVKPNIKSSQQWRQR